MIRQKIKIHDSYSVEQKYWFELDKSADENHFEVKSWIAASKNLEVNRASFSRTRFYSTLKSHFRLMTPKYGIKYIVKESNSPFAHVQSAINQLGENLNPKSIADFEYHVKMYANIFKSSIRDRAAETTEEIDEFIEDVKKTVFAYGSLNKSIEELKQKVEQRKYESLLKTYRNGEEYIIFLSMKWAYELISERPEMSIFVKEMIHYREERGYKGVSINDKEHNAEMIYKWSKFKRIHSSELFFTQNSKKDGVFIEQFYYSIAAGLSMIFATVIAFSFQQKYGNFTMPVFVALVVSYMLKDRIKEILRYYFAHKKRKKYFDNKISIKIGKTQIALCKESFDFIPESNLPDFIKETIDVDNYQLSLYRKNIEIDKSAVESHSEYSIEGINNIVRRNFSDHMSAMDNPTESVFCLDENDNLKELTTDKIYHFYLFVETKHNEKRTLTKHRIIASRLGLIRMEQLNN